MPPKRQSKLQKPQRGKCTDEERVIDSEDEVSEDSVWSDFDENDVASDDDTPSKHPQQTHRKKHKAQKRAAYLAFTEPWQRLSFLKEFPGRFTVKEEADYYVIVPGPKVGENYFHNKKTILNENKFFFCSGEWKKIIAGNEMNINTLQPVGYVYKGAHDNDIFAF
tara:strand:+ start:359 stop:853 length:495 start_codon:yes stop_codon:yes gene_type:complete